ncbi:MAG: thioesterase family protein [Candidatus Eisenbacteria bacterium]
MDTKPHPEVPSYEIPIDIRNDDVDQLGHVNNVVYLRWVQEAAIAHWTATALPEDQAALVWVVSRHEIDYKRPVMRDDEVFARTWVGKALDRDFERYTEIVRRTDGKTVAEARTLWCPLDRRTFRPTVVGESVRRRFSVSSPEN